MGVDALPARFACFELDGAAPEHLESSRRHPLFAAFEGLRDESNQDAGGLLGAGSHDFDLDEGIDASSTIAPALARLGGWTFVR